MILFLLKETDLRKNGAKKCYISKKNQSVLARKWKCPARLGSARAGKIQRTHHYWVFATLIFSDLPTALLPTIKWKINLLESTSMLDTARVGSLSCLWNCFSQPRPCRPADRPTGRTGSFRRRPWTRNKSLSWRSDFSAKCSCCRARTKWFPILHFRQVSNNCFCVLIKSLQVH